MLWPISHNKNSMIKKKIQTILFFRNANKQKTFLLLRTNQRRKNFWQNITGSLDEGESFESAAIREAQEETGLIKSNIQNTSDLDLSFEFFDQWKEDVLEKCFAIEVKDQFPIQIDTSEHDQFKWVHEDEINRDIVKFESNWKALEKAKTNL